MTIPEYMRHHGLNQTQFSELVGVAKSRVSDWIRGEAEPDPESIRKIIRVTGGGVTANEILGIIVVPPAPQRDDDGQAAGGEPATDATTAAG